MVREEKMKEKKTNIKSANLTQFALGVIIIILLNIIGSYVFTRIDLTTEKRYSLSDATKKMLDNIHDLVFFRVYLEGEFPAGFKRLARETKEMLDEMRAYNPNIEYEFINPSQNPDDRERQKIYRQLVEKGLSPTDLKVKTKDGTSTKIIFPGAIASYHGHEMPVELLLSQRTATPEEILNNSIENLEFSLADAIRKLVANHRPKIAFIEGHGELNQKETADITLAFRDYYTVERITLNEQLNSLTKRTLLDSINNKYSITNKYDAIIIAKPDSAFSEKDKFIIDQYIMRGGKVLWLVDPVFASMDSLQVNFETMGISMDLHLTDMFFKYGVRLNNNLVMDLNALQIPIKVGEMGNQPQFDFFPWYYFPILTPTSDHPIVRNLNAIKTEFISSIDLVNDNPQIKKTILLSSSRYSRTVNVPAEITLAILGEKPDERLYNKQHIPVGVLLEGQFESLYANRLPPEITDDKGIGFQETSKNTKMIVIADGDIIKNQMQLSNGNYIPLPLGYDKYTGQQFGNKELILNTMNYLTDDSGLISIRSKELKLRLLDRTKVEKERTYWQVLNTIAPVILVLIFGLIQAYFRKRKYGG
jgi:ABC-2 type transport system permease protein